MEKRPRGGRPRDKSMFSQEPEETFALEKSLFLNLYGVDVLEPLSVDKCE